LGSKFQRLVSVRSFATHLWGVNVTEKAESKQDVPDSRDLLITRAALGPGAPKNTPTVVYLVNHDNNDDSYVLGTLRAEACEQFELDINIASESSITLKVTGPGTVHFSGYYNLLPAYGDSFDDELTDSDEIDEMDRRVAAYMGGEDSSSGEDYQETGNVEEITYTDSDIDADEGSKSPVKQKQTQQILPKSDNKPQNQAKQNQPKQQNQTKSQQNQANQQTQAKPQQNQAKPQQNQAKPQQNQQANETGKKKIRSRKQTLQDRLLKLHKLHKLHKRLK